MKRICQKLASRNNRVAPRDGGVAVIMAIVLLMLIGFTALAIDLGYIMMTRAQMQSASDSASLAGGTELLPGLGRFATKTPAEVQTAARPVARDYAALNRNAELNSTYVDENRDVEFGTAVFNPATGEFDQTIGAVPHNMVRVSALRNQSGSGNGDAPVPLFFARAIEKPDGTSYSESSQTVVSAAAIFPANGFTVTEPGEASGVMPFAYKEPAWRRFEKAQRWYDNNGGTPDVIPATAQDATHLAANDPTDPDSGTYTYTDPNTNIDHEVSVFHRHAYDNQGDLQYDGSGNPIWERDIYDQFAASPDPSSVQTQSVSGTAPPNASASYDGMLEVNLYPESTGGAITAGNAGTVDLGDTNNAAQAIADQIRNGLSYDDYQEMENQGMLVDGQLVADPDADPPVEFSAEGDTGISGGPIQQAMDEIIGQTRAILLYDAVAAPGNNAVYNIVEFVGIRVMFARMNTNNKAIWIQQAPHQDGTATPIFNELPGPDTTIFTPLILIE